MDKSWAEVRTEESKLYMLVAIDRGELFRAHFFEYACAQNDIFHRLTEPNHPWSDEDQKAAWGTVFPRKGQVERMNRTIKEAAVHRYHHESHDRLRTHLKTFLNAYNFAKRLTAIKGLTPFEAICKAWAEQPKGSTLKQPSTPRD